MTKKHLKKSFTKTLLTTGDIAHYCHTTVVQVNRWIKKGELKTIQTLGGHNRITLEEFKDFLKRNEIPITMDISKISKKKNILVADDDADLANGISEILKNQYKEYKVEVAFDGYETLISVGNINPDLLILDIRMPKIDGLDVCRRIRENKAISPKIKILAITGHSEAYNRNTVLAAGANEYLLKPIDKDILLKYVEKLL